MRKNKFIPKFFIGMMIVSVLGFSNTSMLYADELLNDKKGMIEIETNVNNEVGSKSTQYVWYYKEENGKSYRRLFDATNEVWVTDWILCD